jgi:hypothetical protein
MKSGDKEERMEYMKTRMIYIHGIMLPRREDLILSSTDHSIVIFISIIESFHTIHHNIWTYLVSMTGKE